MGILRIYLATCVIAAHSESILPWGMHDGRQAVQIFFIISGFYMQLILQGEKYQNTINFYQSRLLRIYVPYFSISLVVIFTSLFTGIFFSNWLTLSEIVNLPESGTTGGLLAFLTNFSLIFQDWVMFFEHEAGERLRFTSNFGESSQPLWHYLWIPQAWSVGLELTFYAFAPLLALKFSTKQLIGLAAFSLIMRLVAYKALELGYDPWTYRFFPFELSNFVYGMLGCRLMRRLPKEFGNLEKLAKNVQDILKRITLPVFSFATLIFLWIHFTVLTKATMIASSSHPVAGEILYLFSLSLWMIIIPIFFTLTRNNRIDRNVGELSYSVYLLHYTIVIIVRAICGKLGIPLLVGELTTLITFGAAGILQIVVFNRFESWRKNFIQRRANQSG